MTRVSGPKSAAALTVIQLTEIVESRLPGWKKACGSPMADAIVLHELAFGTSDDELFLLACAIKYAAHRGKNVHVVCGTPAKDAGRGRARAVGPTFRD
jgi:hypothetical protein